ncbi:hypothetical protein TSST111916_13525 [Tsukamurella strandjordii]|uniref:phthiocerol/phthiodiolone dimycocerosyl transferase family protein n=1 Tax=Tsukamurella TaxID=2060 RepID=UPI001C7CA511|nr:hypothetical protein [Tsukamurella sp. TY48]GIZ96201.1 hypothetical protein TTY48_08130 [Tsukamurella sp. TY48]
MNATLRPLALSERGFVGPYPTTVAFELTLRGDLDLAALSDALTALRGTHPALDAAVVADGADFAFVVPAEATGAALTVDRVDTLPEIAVPPLVDPGVALGRLHVVTAGDRHRVSLAINHALGDGTYLFTLFSQLFAHYTALVRTGGLDAARPQEFPSSAQEILREVATVADTGRERLDGIRWYGAAPTLDADGAPAAPRLPEVASLRFSEDVTAGFAAAASGVGMNALLSGVLLCAERVGFLDADPAESIRIGAMTLADMRRRIQPALAATAVTNFVGASFAAPELTALADPIAVGAAIADTVRADVAAGRSLAVLAAPAPPGPAEPPVVLSNLGALALDLPDTVEAEHLRPLMSMDSAGLHGPAGQRRPSPSATIFQASTFQGRLGIEAITLGGTASPAARSAVADRIAALVHAAARLAPAA